MIIRICLLFALAPCLLVSQSLELVGFKKFHGTGVQTMESLVAGNNGTSYALFSYYDQIILDDQITLGRGNVNADYNLVLVKFDSAGNMDWYKRMYSLNHLSYLDMIFLDSALIILFDQEGVGYYDDQAGIARSAGNGDYTIVQFSESGSINWHRRFEADRVLNYTIGGKRSAALAADDSSHFYVALSHLGSFDADLSAASVQPTPDGGGENLSLIKYDIDFNYLKMVNWPTAADVILEDFAVNNTGQLLVALKFAGQLDLDPSASGTTLKTSPVNGWNNHYNFTHYLIAIDEYTSTLDWYQRIHSDESLRFSEVVFDYQKQNWWATGYYRKDITTYDSPAFSRNTPYAQASNAFYFAYNNVGQRVFTAEHISTASSSIKNIPVSFIPSEDGYWLYALNTGGSLDFRLGQSYSDPNYSGLGMLISKYDSLYNLQYAYKRLLSYPYFLGLGLPPIATRLGPENYLFGYNTNSAFNSLAVSPQHDSILFTNSGSEAILIEWKQCEDLDTTISYQAGVFSAADTTANLYEWISCFDGSVLHSGPDPFFQPSIRTWAYLRFTKNKCVYRSACIIANDVGLEELGENLEVYPNPASHFVKVKWSGPKALALELYSMQGQKLDTWQALRGERLFPTPFPAGVYWLRAPAYPEFNLKLILK